MSVQFVFCGLAGFAATVGFAYAKHRLSPTQDPSSSTAEHASALGTGAKELGHQDEKDYAHPEHMSLKRKSVDDHDSLSTRPRKKSRSPPVEEAIKFPDVIYGLPARAPAIAPPVVESADDICMTSPNIQPLGILPLVLEAEAAELKSRDASQGQFILEKAQDLLGPLLPAVAEVTVLDLTPVAPVAPITPPSSPPPTFAKRVPGRGFSAFAGSGAGSPFAASSLSPQRRSSFATTTPQRPVWRSAEAEDGALPSTSSPSPFAPSSSSSSAVSPSPNGPRQAPDWVGPAEAGPSDALAAVETRVTTPVAHVTGEENEIIKDELKGVKLFIKRGNKAFTGGMPGHIKRLAHSERADQRLLFRREPLGKVSMNVPMSPAVRCSFDAEDGILRIVLKEATTAEGGNGAGTHELVVYAIKRGRVPKQDFTEFAETLTAAYAPKAQAGTT